MTRYRSLNLLAIAGWTYFASPAEGAAPDLNIHGFVQDATTLKRIGAARVTADSSRAGDTTDNDGEFHLAFPSIQGGTMIRIHAQRAGYAPFDKYMPAAAEAEYELNLEHLATADPPVSRHSSKTIRHSAASPAVPRPSPHGLTALRPLSGQGSCRGLEPYFSGDTRFSFSNGLAVLQVLIRNDTARDLYIGDVGLQSSLTEASHFSEASTRNSDLPFITPTEEKVDLGRAGLLIPAHQEQPVLYRFSNIPASGGPISFTSTVVVGDPPDQGGSFWSRRLRLTCDPISVTTSTLQAARGRIVFRGHLIPGMSGKHHLLVNTDSVLRGELRVAPDLGLSIAMCSSFEPNCPRVQLSNGDFVSAKMRPGGVNIDINNFASNSTPVDYEFLIADEETASTP